MPPRKPPAALSAIRAEILAMTNEERRYLRAWVGKWIRENGDFGEFVGIRVPAEDRLE